MQDLEGVQVFSSQFLVSSTERHSKGPRIVNAMSMSTGISAGAGTNVTRTVGLAEFLVIVGLGEYTLFGYLDIPGLC